MVCVFAVCSVAKSDQGPTTTVYTALVRIPAGTVLANSQARTTAVPVGLVPAGALTSLSEVSGQMTQGPIPVGAILTQDDFVSSSQAEQGYVIIPLSVSPQVLSVLKPGDKVSIFVSNPATGEVAVTRGARVVTIPAETSSGMFSSGSSGSFALIEVPEATATQLTSIGSMGSTTVAIE